MNQRAAAHRHARYTSRSSRLSAQLTAGVLLCACAGVTPGTEEPQRARPDAEELPPRLPAALPWSVSASLQAGEARLDNGLSLRVLERRALPLLELRLVIESGSASDAEDPGVAALTLGALELMAELAAGREPAARAEALGARLRLQVRRDACVIALSLPSSALAEGLALLAELIAPPSWAPAAFEAARARELSRLQERQRSPSWLAEQALYAELFRSAQHHPYAHADSSPGALQRLTLDDSRAWYERHFSPRNAALLVVGDISAEELTPLVQQALGGWQGADVRQPVLPMPAPATTPKMLLVHHEGASRSELRIGVLGPARAAPDWPAFAATQQVLAGEGTSRMRRELTRQGELAVDSSSILVPVAHGATPLLIAAATSTERTGLVLAALLDSLRALAHETPKPRELRAAQGQLLASVPLALETNASAAELLVQNRLWQLPSGALDELQRQIARLKAGDVQGSARRYFSAPPVVVVVGDAERLLTPLSRFAQVHLLDAERDFRTERVVSQDPTAPLEGPARPPAPETESRSRP